MDEYLRHNPPGTAGELVDSLKEVKEILFKNHSIDSEKGSIGRTNLQSGFDVYFYNITRGIDQDEKGNTIELLTKRSREFVDFSLKSRQFISSIGKQFIPDGMVRVWLVVDCRQSLLMVCHEW